MTLLPDDEAVSGDVNDIDLDDLRVDFSSEEASSEARDFTPVPSGNYHVAITKVELRKCGPNSKNPGKPYYNLTLTCQQDGPYKGRNFWGSVMLFNGALYSLAQLEKALGMEDYISSGKVPSPDELLGEELIIGVQKVRDKYKEEQEGGDEKLFKNEVKNYRPLSGSASVKLAGDGGSDSLMP